MLLMQTAVSIAVLAQVFVLLVRRQKSNNLKKRRALDRRFFVLYDLIAGKAGALFRFKLKK